MSLRLFNALTGKIEEFRAEAPPRVAFSRDYPVGHPFEVLESSLTYLGFKLEAAKGPVELHCGLSAAPAGTLLWLRPEAGWGRLVLKIHYREVRKPTDRELDDAREEWAYLADTARRLKERHGSAAANPAGVAGYKKRFRDALSNDLDFPAAMASLRDALRPGALSPGSQLAALGEARSAFGAALPFD